MEEWKQTPGGLPQVHGATWAQAGMYGDFVLLRLQWVGPLDDEQQANGQVQTLLDPQLAYDLGQELIQLSGKTGPLEPEGNA